MKKFWKAKSAENFNNNLPVNSNDPATLIFKAAMTELIKTKRQSSSIQAARVERILEIATDNEIKKLKKISLFSYNWLYSSIHRIIWNCLGNNEFFSVYCHIKKYKSCNCSAWNSRGSFATALGLLAAIPAVVAYNKFNSDSRRYFQE